LCLIEDYEDLQFLLNGLIPFIVLASALDSVLLHEIEIWNSRNGDFLPLNGKKSRDLEIHFIQLNIFKLFLFENQKDLC
jgi:hypothetical protein